MHRIAAYRLVARNAGDTLSDHRAAAVELLEDWLDAKCAADACAWTPGATVPFPMDGGREATLSHDHMTAGTCVLDEYDLIESDGRTRRRTSVRIASEDGCTEMYVELFAVSENPMDGRGKGESFEAGCPRFVRELLRAGSWCIGDMPLVAEPIVYRGRAEGQGLVRMLRHRDRVLPMVVVSLIDGVSVSTCFPARLAERLAGVAAVATIDEAAAWGLTETMDRQWSCFGGAVRLYWPMHDGDEPRDHPLWTLDRLRGLGATPSIGGRRLIAELTRMTMVQASRTLAESPLLERVRQRIRRARREELVRDNETTWTGMAADLEAELERAKDARRKLRERNERLERELADRDNEIATLRHELGAATSRGGTLPGGAGGQTLAPDAELPQTVADVVEDARVRHAGLLVFGDEVAGSVRALSPDAGPPAKVRQHLDALADMAGCLREGTLGKNACDWLQDRNVDVSGYGERVSKGGKERDRRTFHDGTDRRVFLKHTKPNGGTSSDRCVRIYFDVSEDRRSVLIGYVGRHLED